MNSGPTTREPPKPKAILATPLNVEESRAQRQQRSQARFRDRGGIFVPSNRNTLADILLGKAEPLKKPRRSVSASPLGHLHKGPSVTQLKRISSPTKRAASSRKGSKSPQKQSRKSNHGDERVETIIERSRSPSPRKPVASTSTLKPKAKPATKPSKEKPPTRSKKASTQDESSNETDVAPPKPKPKAKSKASSKSSKALPEVLEETTDDAVPLESKGKAAQIAKASNTKTSKSLDKPVENPELKASKPPPKSSNPLPNATSAKVASSSTASKRITKPRRSRANASDLYSGASKDEYVPKTSKRKTKLQNKAHASTSTSSTSVRAKGTAKPPPKQTKPSGHLSDIQEEEEEEEVPPTRNRSPPPQISAKIPKASTSQTTKKVESTKSKKHPAQDVSEDEPRQPLTKRTKATVDAEKQADRNGKERSKSKTTPSEAIKGKKRRAQVDDDSELDTPQPPTKRSKAIPDGESISKPTPRSKSKGTAAPLKGSIPADDSSLDEPVHPSAKRSKATGDDKATSSSKSHTKASKTTAGAEPATKKRPRGQDSNDASEMADRRSTKRKKPVSKIEAAPEKTDKVPAGALRVKKGEPRSKKPPRKVAKLSASGKAAETAMKENSTHSGKAAANVMSNKRGPPKSVLERLKARDQPHIIDNDPDPIDFLS